MAGIFRVVALSAALLGLASAPAAAQLAVCNQTLDVLNVAIAQPTAGVFESQGWWTIGANRCVNVIKKELTNRFIYVYAMDVFGQPILTGEQTMCVGPKRFSISGTESCWLRGLKAAKFAEVDTQAVERWTLFLREPEQK